MRFDHHSIVPFVALVAGIFAAASTVGAPPSDTVLPQSVVAYVSVANAPAFDERWSRTQIGQMIDDEVMQPFVEDLRDQLSSKFDGLDTKLGFTLDDLDGVASGEMSLSLIEREQRDAVLAITMDVTDRDEQAASFLAAIERHFATRGVTKQQVDRAGTTLHVFHEPGENQRDIGRTTIYFVKDNLLVGVDDRDQAEAILTRIGTNARDTLQSVAPYQATMERCRRAAGDLEPEVRWFVKPFDFIFAARTLRDDADRAPREDYVMMFAENGFDAIQGVGGFVNLLVDSGVEMLHHTSIFAPPTSPNDPLRWNLSMRMLQLPNSDAFEPQSWVPRMSASYLTLYLDLMTAFDNVGPIFDALQGHKDAWANTLEGWEVDPYGAQINVREEFVANMGQRITIVTDYETPISPDSERSIFAIEANDEQALSAALAKWMKEEPDVERREINGIEVWERVARRAEIEEISIPGFSSIANAPQPTDEDEDFERVLPNSASCVTLGHLLMASDIEYLREILTGFGQHERLGASPDYLQVAEVMSNFAPDKRSAWAFARTDEEFRPVYELVRQNKMPESETMFGRLLNDLLTTDVEKEEGILRKQRIDGSKLPNFEAVRRYFGPAGRALVSQPDGWTFTTVLLNKEAP